MKDTINDSPKLKRGQRGPDKGKRLIDPDNRPGRRSREEMGLPKTTITTVQVEQTVIDAARAKHGSLANALRFSAGLKHLIRKKK